MHAYDQQQKFLPSKLLECDDPPQTKSLQSERDSDRVAVFSAPPILFDIGTRFYEDFLQEITQNDPELDKYGLVKSFKEKHEEPLEPPLSNYRKLSLQTEEEYHSYYSVHVPVQPYYKSLTPEEEILNNLDQAAAWARDQYGSRAVQSIIESGQTYAKDAIFQALLEESIDLTKDKFGNYVFQKIFERGEPAHQQRLFLLVKGNLLDFSKNCYGCRVVQKAIEYTRQRPELQGEVVSLLQPYCLFLIENINGNHVMQKCIEVIELQLLEKILEVVSHNYKQLSLHAYGCRVIQKYLEKLHSEIIYKEEQLAKTLNLSEKKHLNNLLSGIRVMEKEMFEKLVAISVELSQCQYGNYVMQHIVNHSKEYKVQIQNIFLDNFVLLSCNKYASNVIERVIKLANQAYRQQLAHHLALNENLVSLAKHQFGNYVIQSLIQLVPAESRQHLKSKLRENAQEISKSSYGKHVLLQLQKWK